MPSITQEVAALEDWPTHPRNHHFLASVSTLHADATPSVSLIPNQRSQGANCLFPGGACVDGTADCVQTYPLKASPYEPEHARYLPPPILLSGPRPSMRSVYA